MSFGPDVGTNLFASVVVELVKAGIGVLRKRRDRADWVRALGAAIADHGCPLNSAETQRFAAWVLSSDLDSLTATKVDGGADLARALAIEVLGSGDFTNAPAGADLNEWGDLQDRRSTQLAVNLWSALNSVLSPEERRQIRAQTSTIHTEAMVAEVLEKLAPIGAQIHEVAHLLAREATRGVPQALTQPLRRRGVLSASMLLRAEQGVVPFRGRTADLEELLVWCSDLRSSRFRLLTGPGGRGKTRLAHEFAERMTASGWEAGFLRPDRPHQHLDLRPVLAMSLPTLLIIDYAEAKLDQLDRLLDLLDNVDTARPLRVLLLARSTGEWWSTLRHRYLYELEAATTSSLATLDDSIFDRREAFREAVSAFADNLSASNQTADWATLAESVQEPADLDRDEFGSPLTLQMSALTALLDTASTEEDDRYGELEKRVLRHEKKYWNETALAHHLNLSATTLALVVATSALLGAKSHDEAQHTLARLPGLRDASEDRRIAVDRWLQDLYPSSIDEHWGSLQPDRIAESHISAQSIERESVLGELLAGATEAQIMQALSVLRRAASRSLRLRAILNDLLVERRSDLEPFAVAVTFMNRAGTSVAAIEATRIYDAISADDRQLLWDEWVRTQ